MSSYVEGEQFGIVTLLLEQRLGDIDPQWAEGRNPVDPDADRQAGLRRIAQEKFLETRRGDEVVAGVWVAAGTSTYLTGLMKK